MLKELINQKLLDIDGFILLNYKKLNLSENEVMILLVLLHLEKMNVEYIIPSIIAQYMTLDEKTIDRLIIGLINKKLVTINKNSLSTEPLMFAITKVTSISQTKSIDEKINLVACFEKEFSRSLTPIEIETIKEWKQCQYDDQMILKALKEATLSNVHNMRYIDKILVEWAKYGVKSSGREGVDQKEKTVDLVNYEWWNE